MPLEKYADQSIRLNSFSVLLFIYFSANIIFRSYGVIDSIINSVFSTLVGFSLAVAAEILVEAEEETSPKVSLYFHFNANPYWLWSTVEKMTFFSMNYNIFLYSWSRVSSNCVKASDICWPLNWILYLCNAGKYKYWMVGSLGMLHRLYQWLSWLKIKLKLQMN